MTHRIDLTGQTALITGASRGIGEATARHLAQLGANVALAARSGDEVQRIANETGPKAIGLECDVSEWGQAHKAVEQTLHAFGQVDLLVNNAGLIDPIALIETVDPLAWGQVVDVNIKGAFNMLRAVVPGMLETKEGLGRQYLFRCCNVCLGRMVALLRNKGRVVEPDAHRTQGIVRKGCERRGPEPRHCRNRYAENDQIVGHQSRKPT